MPGDEHGSQVNDAVGWYDDHADEVVGHYESLAPAKLNEWLRGFLPDGGGFILDVGAGSGRDAAWLTSIGYEVIAVEPSEQMRKRGQALQGAAAITWLNDRLPGLENVHGRGLSFDFILANAVWMHLPPGEARQRAFRKLVTLLKPGARPAQLAQRRADRSGHHPCDSAPRRPGSLERASMAREVGISPGSVYKLWKSNDLKPHLVRTFKISTDPHFEQKFWDVIGLYLNPPEKALVLCCDEKSQCQALERTQPGPPLGVGHIRTKTHDYKRHGTLTLFAALNYLEGKIIARSEPKHTHVEWLRFLKQIDRETPPELEIHLIADNYSAYKHPKVKEWLKRRPRFVMHFTPTSSSWLNLVERFFAELTEEVVREGSFKSVPELLGVIEDYLLKRNQNPKPYRWHAKGHEILAKIQRARQAAAAAD